MRQELRKTIGIWLKPVFAIQFIFRTISAGRSHCPVQTAFLTAFFIVCWHWYRSCNNAILDLVQSELYHLR
jgi:hypothetical protein